MLSNLSMTSPSLVDPLQVLPAEVMWLVLNCLSGGDLCNASQVSRAWYHLIHGSTTLRQRRVRHVNYMRHVWASQKQNLLGGGVAFARKMAAAGESDVTTGSTVIPSDTRRPFAVHQASAAATRFSAVHAPVTARPPLPPPGGDQSRRTGSKLQLGTNETAREQLPVCVDRVKAISGSRRVQTVSESRRRLRRL